LEKSNVGLAVGDFEGDAGEPVGSDDGSFVCSVGEVVGDKEVGSDVGAFEGGLVKHLTPEKHIFPDGLQKMQVHQR
jgi:hypothetical protein